MFGLVNCNASILARQNTDPSLYFVRTLVKEWLWPMITFVGNYHVVLFGEGRLRLCTDRWEEIFRELSVRKSILSGVAWDKESCAWLVNPSAYMIRFLLVASKVIRRDPCRSTEFRLLESEVRQCAQRNRQLSCLEDFMQTNSPRNRNSSLPEFHPVRSIRDVRASTVGSQRTDFVYSARECSTGH